MSKPNKLNKITPSTLIRHPNQAISNKINKSPNKQQQIINTNNILNNSVNKHKSEKSSQSFFDVLSIDLNYKNEKKSTIQINSNLVNQIYNEIVNLLKIKNNIKDIAEEGETIFNQYKIFSFLINNSLNETIFKDKLSNSENELINYEETWILIICIYYNQNNIQSDNKQSDLLTKINYLSKIYFLFRTCIQMISLSKIKYLISLFKFIIDRINSNLNNNSLRIFTSLINNNIIKFDYERKDIEKYIYENDGKSEERKIFSISKKEIFMLISKIYQLPNACYRNLVYYNDNYVINNMNFCIKPQINHRLSLNNKDNNKEINLSERTINMKTNYKSMNSSFYDKSENINNTCYTTYINTNNKNQFNSNKAYYGDNTHSINKQNNIFSEKLIHDDIARHINFDQSSQNLGMKTQRLSYNKVLKKDDNENSNFNKSIQSIRNSNGNILNKSPFSQIYSDGFNYKRGSSESISGSIYDQPIDMNSLGEDSKKKVLEESKDKVYNLTDNKSRRSGSIDANSSINLSKVNMNIAYPDDIIEGSILKNKEKIINSLRSSPSKSKG